MLRNFEPFDQSTNRSCPPVARIDDCKAKSNLGWVCTGPTKKGVKGSKLAKREARDDKIAGKRDASFMNIDLKTVRIPRIESDFDAWLTDSVESAVLPDGSATPDEKSAQKHREMKPITVHFSRKIINSPMIKLIFRDFPQTLIAIVNIFSSFLVSTRTFKIQLYFIKNSLYHNDVWAMSYVSLFIPQYNYATVTLRIIMTLCI